MRKKSVYFERLEPYDTKKFSLKNAKVTFLIRITVQLRSIFVYSFSRTSKFVYQSILIKRLYRLASCARPV